MQHGEFIEEVVSKLLTRKRNGSKPVKMAAGNGVLIVEDPKGTFNIYFVRSKWTEADQALGVACENEKIGILPGDGITNFDKAFEFASGQLNSKQRTCSFYHQLQPVN